MKPIRNEKGVALIYVILVMTVGIILVAGMMTVSLAETKQTVYQTDQMKAYYIARAGAESMVYRMQTIDSKYWDDFNTEQTTNLTPFGDGTVAVSVKRTGAKFYVVSTGTYRGANQKVTAVLKYNPHTALDYALYAKTSMDSLLIKSLEGTIASGGTIGFNPGHNYSGQAEQNVPLNVAYSGYNLDDVESYFSSQTPQTISGTAETDVSSIFDKVDTGNNTTWTIDTAGANFQKKENSDGSVQMVTGTTDPWMIVWLKGASTIGNNGAINITGNHNLMIIVENSLELNGPITLGENVGKVEIHVIGQSTDGTDKLVIQKNHTTIGDPDSPSRLITYLSDGSQMTLDVNSDFYGYIIGPGATVSMKNGNTEFYGAVYANVVTATAGPSIFYRAPENDDIIYMPSIQFAYWE